MQVHASEKLTISIDGKALVDHGVAAVLYAINLVRQLCRAIIQMFLLRDVSLAVVAGMCYASHAC